MSHRPSHDPDSPQYSNDDPSWNERKPPTKIEARVHSGHCRWCGRSTARVVRSDDEVAVIKALGMLCRWCYRAETIARAIEEERP